jgi:adenylate cyclase
MEIERKFLVKSLPPGWRASPSSKIRQGYFSINDKDVEVRLREKGSQCFITIKSGRGKVRLEEEIRISEGVFKRLWPLVRAASLVKTRHRIPYAGSTIELDVYEGRHRGLKTADVEFRSRRQVDSFKPPAWFGQEITGKERYANRALARRKRV